MTQKFVTEIASGRSIGWVYRFLPFAGFPYGHRWIGLELLAVMAKSPAFQFYPNDWLSSPKIALMTPEQEGAYIRLLCYDWANDGIPDDDSALAQLSRLCEGWFANGSTIIRKCFAPHPKKPGFLTNERLDAERNKQAEWLEKSRQGGRKSGKSRRGNSSWGRTLANKKHHANPTSQMVPTKCEPPCEPPANSSSSSSSSNNSTPIVPKGTARPTIEDVKARCIEIGLPESEGEAFMDYYESNGWRVGRNPMKSWTHSLAIWKRNQGRFGPKQPINGQPKQPTMWELSQVIKMKEEERDRIYAEHYSPDGFTGWDDDFEKMEYKKLQEEIRILKEQSKGLIGK